MADGEITFCLEYATPTLNELMRMKWYVRRKMKKTMAHEIAAQLFGKRPSAPIHPAHITIWRQCRSAGPDRDNLVGGCKDLVDILQPSSQQRKFGLGIIAGDGPRDVTVEYLHVTGPAKTTVQVRQA